LSNVVTNFDHCHKQVINSVIEFGQAALFFFRKVEQSWLAWVGQFTCGMKAGWDWWGHLGLMW
jgi:hypothetical protein